MALGLLGIKVGMTQVYDDEGKIAPVTILQVGPCPVLQVKTKGTKSSGSDRVGTGDGYFAVQLGLKDKPRRGATRAERGHVSGELQSKRRGQTGGQPLAPKANCEPQRYIREFRLDAAPEFEVGKLLLAADLFQAGQAVDVTGTSKGRGTTGAMKRHNFHGLPASHGVKKHHRAPGSVGSHASNRGSGRPKRGKRMAGRYGAERVTVRNLTIVRIDPEAHLILVKGAVPGPNGGLIEIRPTNKRD
jgi:large subunit ribosomal protein L3